MENIRESIEVIAKKVASSFVEDESLSLTDLVVKAAKEANLSAKQAAALVWLSNRHAFAGRMTKGASDEFELADPGRVKLALQSNEGAEELSAGHRPMVASNAQATKQSLPRMSGIEMGPFLVTKLEGADRNLANEETGLKGKMRRIIEHIKGLLGGVQKVALQETPFFAEKMASLDPEARGLVEMTLESFPIEKVSFLSDNPTGRSLVNMAKHDLEEVCKLASEASDLRKRAMEVANDRASLREQITALRTNGLEVTR